MCGCVFYQPLCYWWTLYTNLSFNLWFDGCLYCDNKVYFTCNVCYYWNIYIFFSHEKNIKFFSLHFWSLSLFIVLLPQPNGRPQWWDQSAPRENFSVPAKNRKKMSQVNTYRFILIIFYINFVIVIAIVIFWLLWLLLLLLLLFLSFLLLFIASFPISKQPMAN